MRDLFGSQTEAYGPGNDETPFKFRFKVVDAGDLVTSHTGTLEINKRYPSELQPRIRERAASRLQIESMAANLNPRMLLRDTGMLDSGIPIVGADDVVESGNGRVLAIRQAEDDHPDKYRLYRNMLIDKAGDYGLDPDKIEDMKHPVLVRERLTQVNRAEFAAKANASTTLRMSPSEEAKQDAKRLPDKVLEGMDVKEDETVEQALRRKDNAAIVAKFYQSIPENERASITDAKGELTSGGMQRLKRAIFAKTYTGEAGERLSRIFAESLDPGIKQIETGLYASLPEMAKAESLIGVGDRDKALSVAPDMAEVVDVYSTIKQSGLSVDKYLAQHHMFEERLTPIQKQMLQHLDDIGRSPKKIREWTDDMAGQIIAAPAPQQGGMGMFGAEYKITKGGIINASINKQRKEANQPALENPETTARTHGLEKPGPGTAETVGTVHAGHAEASELRKETGEKAAIQGTAQVGLPGVGPSHAQTAMLAEWGTAPGAGGRKETLIDVEKEKAKAAAKPLEGQTELATVTPPKAAKSPDHPRKPQPEVHKAVSSAAEMAAIHAWYDEHPDKDKVRILEKEDTELDKNVHLTDAQKENIRQALRARAAALHVRLPSMKAPPAPKIAAGMSTRLGKVRTLRSGGMTRRIRTGKIQ